MGHALLGRVTRVSLMRQRGEIVTDTGQRFEFERTAMVSYMEFVALRPGDWVRFELEGDEPINVERADPRQRRGA